MKVSLHHGNISAIRASILHCWTNCYRADTKTLSCQCHLFLLFSQDLCTPIGQQWYQVTEKQKKLTRVLHYQEHDQERVLVSASYSEQVDHIWMVGTRAPGRVAACGYPGHQNATRSIPREKAVEDKRDFDECLCTDETAKLVWESDQFNRGMSLV